MKGIYACLLFVILTLGVRLQYITYDYPDLDQAEAMYHASKILSGGVLYSDSFTHHHPGVIVLALVARLFSQSQSATNWLGLTLTLSAGAIVSFSLFRIVPPLAATLGALICTLAYFPADVPFYPQSLTAVFVALLLWLHTRSNGKSQKMWLARGLICGLAFAADQRCALLVLPVLLEVWVEHGNRLKPIVWAVAGFAAGVAPLFLYLISFHVLNDYIYQCWVFPATVRTNGLALWSVIATGLKLHTVLNGGLVIAALAGLMCRLRKTGKVPQEVGYFSSFAAALFIISAAGNETFSNYLIVWFPLLGFLCGNLFGQIQTRFELGRFLSGITAALLILLSMGTGQVKSLFTWEYFLYSPDNSVRSAATYVRANIAKDEDLYVWGYYPQFYLYADKFSRFRHVNQIAMTGAYFAQDRAPHFEPTNTPAFAEFARYMTDTPPKHFVIYDDVQSWKTFDQRIAQARLDPSNHLHLLAVFIYAQLDSHYELVKKQGEFSIYKLR